MRAYVLCQAGAGIGLGHFSRVSRIATALESQLRATVQIYVVVPQGETGGFNFSKANLVSPLLPLRAQLFKHNSVLDLFVVDVPPQQVSDDLRDCLAAARTVGATIVSVDNLELSCNADLVFLPTFRRPNIRENGDSKALIVHGWDCFLLEENTESINWRPGQKVLALTGGSDATNLGSHWPALLDASLPATTELIWVTGPFATSPRLPSPPRIKITEHEAPSRLRSLMQCTNYAITVYGVSFYELLQLGIPTVVFSPYGEKDLAELNEIKRDRLAVVASNNVDAVEKLVGLMANHSLASELASRGSDRLKYPGVNRLCEEIRFLQSRKRHRTSN